MHRPEHDFKTVDYYIGDPHRNLIAKQIFEVNGQALQIESTSNDSLVVIGQTDYKVCPACGYASETGIPLEHKNSRGYRCVNKEGNSAEYRLSHDFKTDVAIDFRTPDLKITVRETTLQSSLWLFCIISRFKLQNPVILCQHLHLADGNGVEFCQPL